jgi:lycopene cyclase domain-containing protein
MAVARHGAGPGAVLSALASQIHPVFMLPPVAASLFGASLAGEFDVGFALLHAGVVAAALYVAHVKDGYVDFHGRGEDDDHPLTVRGCRLALAGGTAAFAAGTAAVALLVGVGAALLCLPGWLVGYLHAPRLDTHPVTATTGYPFGVGMALVGGHYVQAGAFAPVPLAFAAVVAVVLSGVKVVDDAVDYEYDRSVDKRTVAVVLGRRRARTAAYATMGLGLFGTLALAVSGTFPPGAALAVAAFAAVAAVAARAGDEVATMLLIRGSYLYVAVLVATVRFRPLAGAPLPDVTALGPWTYLATELFWGAVALALLHRSGAWRGAARTVAVLYPFAYLWDWYTLRVGVFAIPMRTGVELLGVPIEEHLFMLVVPAMVVGVHETLRERSGPADPERG